MCDDGSYFHFHLMPPNLLLLRGRVNSDHAVEAGDVAVQYACIIGRQFQRGDLGGALEG